MKKFFKGFLSVILVILLMITQIALGSIYSFRNIVDSKNISKAVQNIDLKDILYTNGELNDLGKSIEESFVESGFEIEDFEELINTKTLKRVIGDYIGSATMTSIDPNEKLILPTKSDYHAIIDECFDIMNKNRDMEMPKEELKEEIDANYDSMIEELINMAKELADDIRGDTYE